MIGGDSNPVSIDEFLGCGVVRTLMGEKIDMSIGQLLNSDNRQTEVKEMDEQAYRDVQVNRKIREEITKERR